MCGEYNDGPGGHHGAACLKEQYGLATRIVSDRMNRRKLDIMPFRMGDLRRSGLGSFSMKPRALEDCRP